MKELPRTSAFAGDDGAADTRLARTLKALPDAGSLEDVVAALAEARVLVPVLARLEESGTTAAGLHVDKEASAGVVALRTPDGRAGLPVFSSIAALARWRADARPVPVEGARAALAAMAEGWDVLVVDPGGPVTAMVPRPAVRALADGRPWRPAVHDGEVRGEVRRAVGAALAAVPGVRSADAEPGRRAEVAVVLAVVPGLDRPGLDRVLADAGRALAADEVVATEVDTLELRVVAAPG